MTISRGWTPIEGDKRWDEDGYFDQVKARCDGLARWWSEIHTRGEETLFQRQWERENGGGYDPGEDCPRASWYEGRENDPEYIRDLAEFEATLKAWEDDRRAREEQERAQVEFIEGQLQDLGARMMRPYEHWNEDEAYMAYMERDR